MQSPVPSGSWARFALHRGAPSVAHHLTNDDDSALGRSPLSARKVGSRILGPRHADEIESRIRAFMGRCFDDCDLQSSKLTNRPSGSDGITLVMPDGGVKVCNP